MNCEFNSIFANELNEYLDTKKLQGFRKESFHSHLRIFDKFCCEHKINTPTFSRDMADIWIMRRLNEASTTQYGRVNCVRHFLSFLFVKGYDVVVTRDISFKKTSFEAHIYSDEEINRYFLAVDSFSSCRNRMTAVQYPILFRLLYCCGTRITETLNIKKKDVDLENGVIRLIETKNSQERFISVGPDMQALLNRFADKTFYLLSDTDYIFTNAKGGMCDSKTVYNHHRMFLKQADIPFKGNGNGPRLHDWRHSFCVYSMKKMIDEGKDMYVALPILSTYLGHETIYATEKYIRLTMSIYPYIESKFKDKLDSIFGEY